MNKGTPRKEDLAYSKNLDKKSVKKEPTIKIEKPVNEWESRASYLAMLFLVNLEEQDPSDVSDNQWELLRKVLACLDGHHDPDTLIFTKERVLRYISEALR